MFSHFWYKIYYNKANGITENTHKVINMFSLYLKPTDVMKVEDFN